MKDQSYMDPELKLADFAQQIGTSPRRLSSAIKQVYDYSFTDYINHARVNEAKKLLENDYFANVSLADIGLQSGFNPRSSFNQMFKRITKQTPSEYRNRVLSNELDITA